MKRKYHLAFRLRDLVVRSCTEVPDNMGYNLLLEIEKHLEEETEVQPEETIVNDSDNGI